MERKFKENQWVKLIGGERKMRVVKYLTLIISGGKDAFGFPKKDIDTETLTGVIECVWIDNEKECYGDFNESSLEACD